MDGHHRIAAYQQAGWAERDVPVEAFSGTLEDAIARAAKGNTRDKLSMSSREKTETAWRLTTTEPPYSKATVVDISGVSDGTVASMRRVKAMLLKKNSEHDLSDLTWRSARMLAEGKADEEINWEEQTEKEAQDLAKLLVRHLGKRGYQRREAFARALEIYDATLPGFLQEHWELNAQEDEG